MSQHSPYSGITPGARLTDYAGLDLTVKGGTYGGMGIVVWGPNALRGNQVTALKLLQPDRLAAAPSPEARMAIERQFEAEALTWCHLWPHQSIIAAKGLTRLPGLGDLPVLELEYAPNGSVREQLRRSHERRQPLPLRAALAWALHVAAALAHIHQPDPNHDRPNPLVHCDLKLENVLLDAHGWAKLTDLGLTRAYAALAAATPPPQAAPGSPPDRRALVAQLRAELRGQGLLPGSTTGTQPQTPDESKLFVTRTLRIPQIRAGAEGAARTDGAHEEIGVGVAGSPPYMAPEQWRGLAQTVPATDVYALGVLLYELFAGFETPASFPRDPRPYLTPECYVQADQLGYDPMVLAWHAAHTDPAYKRGERGQGAHRLSDPEAQEAALRTGPCAELLALGEEGRQRAETCLAGVDALVERCLAYAPTMRPSAAEVAETLLALAKDPCGQESILVPQPIPSSQKAESAFWSNLGATYSRLGRKEDAIGAQRRALKLGPQDPINWLNLGVALNQIGREAQRSAEIARGWGDMAEATRYFEEALDAFRRGLACLTPETLAQYPGVSAGLATNEANALSDLGRHSEAVAAYERALALSPDKIDTRFNLALECAQWSQAADATPEERRQRLEAAQRMISEVLAMAPEIRNGRALADRIARELADLDHRFQR